MAVLIAEIVGFVVILFVLYRYVLPLVTPLVRRRQDEIQQQVDDSEEATRRLQDSEKRFESAVEEARREAARMRDDARAQATRIREELTAQAEREVERIKQRGQEQLVAQRDQAVRELRVQAGAQSMELAERIVVESLSDESRRGETVDQFLRDLDGMAPEGDRRPEAAGRSAAGAARGGAH